MTTTLPCACHGWWLYQSGRAIWDHAEDCPIGAEEDAQARAAVTAMVVDATEFMTPANRARLTQELATALVCRRP